MIDMLIPWYIITGGILVLPLSLYAVSKIPPGADGTLALLLLVWTCWPLFLFSLIIPEEQTILEAFS